jgi:multidrug efflux system membrane fusion protein
MMRDETNRTRNRVERGAWRRPLLLGLALVVLLGLCACGSDQQPARPAPPVTVANPTVETIHNYFVFTGSTRAYETAEVMARVSGTLESVEFLPSSPVEAGQLLFTIEDTSYRAARDMARATVAAAKADLARAETELRRVEKASQSRAVSEMDVDRARADRDMAIATVASAEASLVDAEKELSYTRVTSPIDGVVSRNLVDRGNLVGQGGPTLLTRVNQVQPIYVYFYAPESLVLLMLDGRDKRADMERESARTPALIQLADEDDFTHEGYVDYLDNQVDPSTGTIEVRARLENEDLALFPGLFVRIKVIGGKIPDAVLVPEVAVGTDLGGKYVLVVGDENIVGQVYVELGAPQAGGMIHIRSGLEGDESIIVNGLMYARPGLPVQPLTAEQMAAMKQQAAQQATGKSE